MKRDILISNNTLNIGGAELSLNHFIQVLEAEANFDVVILSKKSKYPQVEGIQFIDYQGHDTIKDVFDRLPPTKLFGKFKALSRLLTALFFKYVHKKRYRNLKQYDIAIAYNQGDASNYVLNEVQALKKICFYHQGTLEDFNPKEMDGFDTIVSVSYNVKELILSAYPEFANKLLVIKNYINISKEIIDNQYEKPEVFYTGSFNILSIGRLSYEKGFDLAIQAAYELVHTYELDFHWFIIGSGNQEKVLQRLINNLNLTKYVTLLGEKSEVTAYLKHCDLYCQPSRSESYGLAIVEALLQKRRVVSTATLGAREILEANRYGKLCKIAVTDLAESIVSVMKQTHDFESYPIELIKTQNKEMVADIRKLVLESNLPEKSYE